MIKRNCNTAELSWSRRASTIYFPYTPFSLLCVEMSIWRASTIYSLYTPFSLVCEEMSIWRASTIYYPYTPFSLVCVEMSIWRARLPGKHISSPLGSGGEGDGSRGVFSWGARGRCIATTSPPPLPKVSPSPFLKN